MLLVGGGVGEVGVGPKMNKFEQVSSDHHHMSLVRVGPHVWCLGWGIKNPTPISSWMKFLFKQPPEKKKLHKISSSQLRMSNRKHKFGIFTKMYNRFWQYVCQILWNESFKLLKRKPLQQMQNIVI